MPDEAEQQRLNRYKAIIAKIFTNYYVDGIGSFEFKRTEIAEAVNALNIDAPRNLGDVIYAYRYRGAVPDIVLNAASEGLEWIIEGAGRGKYRFNLEPAVKIVPREELLTIKIPDATPEIISVYALNDEQALLAKVRYNRLVDTFLGITAFSLQNHLRTTLTGVGQVELDEVYVGVDRFGRQFVVPVQAKGGKDKHGVVQTRQDIMTCAEKFPRLICRAVSAQFMSEGRIALFELVIQEGRLRVVDEKHYQLVPSSDISPEDLQFYADHST